MTSRQILFRIKPSAFCKFHLFLAKENTGYDSFLSASQSIEYGPSKLTVEVHIPILQVENNKVDILYALAALKLNYQSRIDSIRPGIYLPVY